MVSPGALPPTPDVFPSFKKNFFFSVFFWWFLHSGLFPGKD